MEGNGTKVCRGQLASTSISTLARVATTKQTQFWDSGSNNWQNIGNINLTSLCAKIKKNIANKFKNNTDSFKKRGIIVEGAVDIFF